MSLSKSGIAALTNNHLHYGGLYFPKIAVIYLCIYIYIYLYLYIYLYYILHAFLQYIIDVSPLRDSIYVPSLKHGKRFVIALINRIWQK